MTEYNKDASIAVKNDTQKDKTGTTKSGASVKPINTPQQPVDRPVQPVASVSKPTPQAKPQGTKVPNQEEN